MQCHCSGPAQEAARILVGSPRRGGLGRGRRAVSTLRRSCSRMGGCVVKHCGACWFPRAAVAALGSPIDERLCAGFAGAIGGTAPGGADSRSSRVCRGATPLRSPVPGIQGTPGQALARRIVAQAAPSAGESCPLRSCGGSRLYGSAAQGRPIGAPTVARTVEGSFEGGGRWLGTAPAIKK